MNQQYDVILESSSKELIDSTLSINSEDIQAETPMLKAVPEGVELLATAFIAFTSGVGINIFSQWLYDKVKNHPTEKTVINGNQINAENVTVNLIMQTINCSCNGKKIMNEEIVLSRHPIHEHHP